MIMEKAAGNIGFAARLAGHWSNWHFIAVVLHLGWTYIVGLLFVNLYFYIFNRQRFRADTATIPALQASPVRYLQAY
jgi:nicotinamide riboside transporter PnuC